MDAFSVYAPQLLPKTEPFIPGRRSCKGCGKAIASRIIAKAICETSISLSPKLCIDKSFSYFSPYDQFDTNAAVRQYVAEIHKRSALLAQQLGFVRRFSSKPAVIVSRRIFIEHPLVLSDLLSQEYPILCICLDNEHYLADFIKRYGPQQLIINEAHHQPSVKDIELLIKEKNNPLGILEDRCTYYATACPNYPFDLIEKVRKGVRTPGNAFILVLTPCPTGWIFPPRLTKQVGHSAVRTGYFPLYEKENGRLRFTQLREKLAPIHQFLSLQRRFLTLPADAIHHLQDVVERHYNACLALHKGSA